MIISIIGALSAFAAFAAPTPNPAGSPPPKEQDSCFKQFNTVIKGAPPTYLNSNLSHVHQELYRFNQIQPAHIELIFCRMAHVLSINPNLSALPVTIVKTDPLGHSLSITVSQPTEAFATTSGYTAKAVVANNDETFLTFWWSGSGSTSKGYLIQGANPMQTDGLIRLGYAQWDLTSNTAHNAQYLLTQFETSYLNTTSEPTHSATGGDEAVYANIAYDPTTSSITAQSINIRNPPPGQGQGALGCIKSYVTGTLGGTITAFMPTGGGAETTSSTYTTTADALTSKVLVDSTTTASNAGTTYAGTAYTFSSSCSILAGKSATSSDPFYGNTVNYTLAPADVFQNSL